MTQGQISLPIAAARKQAALSTAAEDSTNIALFQIWRISPKVSFRDRAGQTEGAGGILKSDAGVMMAAGLYCGRAN